VKGKPRAIPAVLLCSAITRQPRRTLTEKGINAYSEVAGLGPTSATGHVRRLGALAGVGFAAKSRHGGRQEEDASQNVLEFANQFKQFTKTDLTNEVLRKMRF
jgi:hypothetical protein